MRPIKELLAMIYPKRCPCCGEVGETDEPCDACRDGIEKERTADKLCRKCGHGKLYCECGKYSYLFEGITAPFYNRGTAQTGVYMLKFKNAPFAADYFGREMAEAFVKHFGDIKADLVCIVPTYRKDSLERNYDKVLLLAKVCAEALGIPLKPRTLKKTRRTERQHDLSHDKRQQNVKGAFEAKGDLDGKTVLLIDDIKTTGYTLNECAKQLRLSGAKKVYCLTALVSPDMDRPKEKKKTGKECSICR